MEQNVNFQISAGARYILRTLTDAGHEAYLVGGCVRDLLRGVLPHDWDICTSARPEETEACFAGREIIKAGLRHGTVAVLVDGAPYEVTTYRTEGPYSDSRRPDYVRFVPHVNEDLARRDFTMNAVAMGLDGRLHDPFGGTGDIRAGLIRCVGAPARRFQEDGLRIMRAVRFSAALGYEIEERTAQAIHENRAMLHRVAAERINTELCGLLTGVRTGGILRQYSDVLCVFWPELEPMIALEQRTPRRCLEAWEHTVRGVEAAPADLTLRLAMLLRDLGKPSCKSTDDKGVDHFYNHPEVGARLADQMLRTLKFDGKTRTRAVSLVARHDMRLPPREQAVRRWLGRLGREEFFQLLEVQRADNLAQGPERAADRLAELGKIKDMAEEILRRGQCLTRRDLALDGRDVIAAGIAPGPEVGRALDWLLDQVISGEAPNNRQSLRRLLEDRR